MSCLYRYIGASFSRLLRLGHIVNKLSSKTMLERNGISDALKTGDGAAVQRARQLSDPKMNFGATEPHVIELEEAKAEWRRRHPKKSAA
jgi:hypothetical protein